MIAYLIRGVGFLNSNNMKCPECNGTGYIIIPTEPNSFDTTLDQRHECKKCNGTGQVEK